MAWKTYLVMYFGTGDGNVSSIVKKVEALGFKSALGPVDFEYDWGNKKPIKEDVFKLADRLSEVLQGTGAIFNLDTHD